MKNSRLKILFDIFLEPAEDEEDIRSYYISKGEDPDAIIERAKDFVKQKEAEIKLKIGKTKQSTAAKILEKLKEVRGEKQEVNGERQEEGNEKQEEIPFGGISFAYRKNNDGASNEEELRKQAEKLAKLKKLLKDSDEHTSES